MTGLIAATLNPLGLWIATILLAATTWLIRTGTSGWRSPMAIAYGLTALDLSALIILQGNGFATRSSLPQWVGPMLAWGFLLLTLCCGIIFFATPLKPSEGPSVTARSARFWQQCTFCVGMLSLSCSVILISAVLAPAF